MLTWISRESNISCKEVLAKTRPEETVFAAQSAVGGHNPLPERDARPPKQGVEHLKAPRKLTPLSGHSGNNKVLHTAAVTLRISLVTHHWAGHFSCQL